MAHRFADFLDQCELEEKLGLLKESDESDDDDDEGDEGDDAASDAALSEVLQKMITFTHTPTADGGPAVTGTAQAPGSESSATGGDDQITSPADLYRLFQGALPKSADASADAPAQNTASDLRDPDPILKPAAKGTAPSARDPRRVSFGENVVREFDKEQTTRQVGETANTATTGAASATHPPPGTMQAGLDSPSTAGLLGGVVERGLGSSAPPDDEAEDRFDRVNHTMEIQSELAGRYATPLTSAEYHAAEPDHPDGGFKVSSAADVAAEEEQPKMSLFMKRRLGLL